MMYGILTALATGLSWTCIGIVLSCCAGSKLAIVPYSFLQTFLTGAAALLLIDFGKITWSDFLILMSFIFPAGCLNSFGQKTVHDAMTRGNHAPVWAIAQSALIFPFLAGILFFQNRGSPGQWIGTGLIIAGIVTPYARKIRQASGWFFGALTAFFIYGLVQILYSMPSQLYRFGDAAGARPLASIWGSSAGWLLIACHQKISLRVDRKTVLVAGMMMLVQLVSLRLFFVSIDALSAANCVNIAFPLMTGANISGFAAYSILIRREKSSPADILGFLLVILGLIFSSVRSVS